MEAKRRLWKLNDIDQWELFNQVKGEEDIQPTSLITATKNEAASQEKAGTKASSQLFYISKTKQEVKGATIYTPKGYGIVQNVIPEKNIITVKINNEIIDFERSEVSNDILIEFIHVQEGAKRSEKISFPIQSTVQDISDRISSQYDDPNLIARLFFKGKELELSNDTLDKLGIIQGSKILVMKKSGKVYSVYRFTQVLSGWALGHNSFEGISFSTSNDIMVTGIGLYTPMHQISGVIATVKLIQGDSPDAFPDCTAEAELRISGIPNAKIQKVSFDKPVLVKEDEIWTIAVVISMSSDTQSIFGCQSYYGNLGNPTILGEADVTFTFSNCYGKRQKSQTNIYAGQIPEIYYYPS